MHTPAVVGDHQAAGRHQHRPLVKAGLTGLVDRAVTKFRRDGIAQNAVVRSAKQHDAVAFADKGFCGGDEVFRRPAFGRTARGTGDEPDHRITPALVAFPRGGDNGFGNGKFGRRDRGAGRVGRHEFEVFPRLVPAFGRQGDGAVVIDQRTLDATTQSGAHGDAGTGGNPRGTEGIGQDPRLIKSGGAQFGKDWVRETGTSIVTDHAVGRAVKLPQVGHDAAREHDEFDAGKPASVFLQRGHGHDRVANPVDADHQLAAVFSGSRCG